MLKKYSIIIIFILLIIVLLSGNIYLKKDTSDYIPENNHIDNISKDSKLSDLNKEIDYTVKCNIAGLSTVQQEECLEKEINKQNENYNKLYTEIMSLASKQYKKSLNDEETYFTLKINTSRVLEDLPVFNKNRIENIKRICRLKEFSSGTSIEIDLNRCYMYYTDMDINLLKFIEKNII